MKWTTVSDSPHDHEREALAWLKSRLPDRPPYEVWANFEFITPQGQVYEVDALAITDNGIHLIEFKAHPGEMVGDAGTWQWTTPDGRFRQLNNPYVLANKKAKVLKSMVERSQAFRKDARSVPFVNAAVFLSDPNIKIGLNPQGRHQVFGRDPEPGQDFPAERRSIGGLVDYLTSLGPEGEGGRPRRRIDRAAADKFSKAMNQLGIREQSSRRQVGDYLIGQLLDDVDESPTEIAYQDFAGKHRSLDLIRRLRIYPLELNATKEQRESALRAARREFELLNVLRHPSVLAPVSFTEHERGPVLIFDYDPATVTLSEFLADPANDTLSVEARLVILRQVAEALAYAHRRGVFHRSLSPSSILLTPTDDPARPLVQIANWHAGARVVSEGTSAQLTGTVHVSALAAADADVFRAPEFAQEGARPAALDVFSLGALGLMILTGQRPASSVKQLRATLTEVGYLDPAAVADGVAPELASVVIEATHADPAERAASLEEFLLYLDLAEQDWNLPEVDEPHPLEARRGEPIGGGRFEVVQRLGQGSTAVALLVKDHERYGELCVLKVAHDLEHNDRLLSEAAALNGLQHSSIAQLLDEPIELAGLTAIVLGYAGPKVDPSRPELRDARTLATRLGDGPVGVELAQRWGQDLLDALRYLEQMGRPHRDIKPENLGVAPRGEQNELHVVLFDFSLAGVSVDSLSAGTPGYLDPFLEARGHWDPAADRYSATVTLFEMATGTKPRYGSGTAHPAVVIEAPNVEPAMFDSAVAEGLTAFFTKALQPDAKQRFGTADEMYWAWHDAFVAADAPATFHPESDDDFVVPASTTRTTPLAALPLSRRAISALERADVLTVGQLLGLQLMQLRSLPGVGARTRGELREARDILAQHFGAAPPDAPAPPVATPAESAAPATQAPDSERSTDEPPAPSSPTTHPGEPETLDVEVQPAELDPLQRIAHAAVPSSARSGENTLRIAQILSGLDQAVDPWASQSEIAAALGLTPGRISQVFTGLRKRWGKLSQVTELRERIRADLAVLQVASVDQIATRLLDNSSTPTVAASARLARGLARIATLTEEALVDPSWISRRRDGAALLAVQSGSDGLSAQALADYAIALSTVAGELVASADVVGRRELLDQLVQVAAPVGTNPIPEAHLADLAADLCEIAAVNSRLEMYRAGLEPLPALRAARRAFVTKDTFTVGDLRSKLASRFPQAAPLPDRPDLDAIITQAGVDLVWNQAAGAYENPAYSPEGLSTAASTHTRYETNVGVVLPTITVDVAVEFDNKMAAARNSGGLLVLLTDASRLDRAVMELGRLADVTADLDIMIVEQLRTITASGKPSWELLVEADAAGPSSAAWVRLQGVIDRALDQLTEKLLATNGTALIHNVGLLARYGRLNRIAAWREGVQDGSTELQALWIVAPADGTSDVPLLDGQPIPVITMNEWSHIPNEWLSNAHNTASRTP